MISELKKMLQKARRNPRYLWYFFQNVNIGRDHFPSLYRRYKLRKRLDVGAAAYLRKLHVILRTTDFEKGSVGVAWEKGICLAPLGWTMAEHLHRSDLSPVWNGMERQ